MVLAPAPRSYDVVMFRYAASRSDLSWRRICMWVIVALVLWLGARAAERHTRLELFSDGGQLRLEADGSTLSATFAVESVERIEIHTMDSAFPPGGRFIELAQRGKGDTAFAIGRGYHRQRLQYARPENLRR